MIVRNRVRCFSLIIPCLIALLFVLGWSWNPPSALAQDEVGSYTIAAGDTLGEIATRFGVSLDALIAINSIEDPNLVRVGQVLLIPNAATDTELGNIATVLVRALPGETLAGLADRHALEPAMIGALNALSETARLFPGQPIALPAGQAPTAPLRFGAVTSVQIADTLMQGRTGRVIVETSRPIALSATWNDLPLSFTPLVDDEHRQFSLLPVPALLAPALYDFTLTYTSNDGVPLTHSWRIGVAEGDYDSQEIVLPDDKGDLLDPALVQAEIEKLNATWLQTSPELRVWGQFARPLSEEYATTSPFGTRRSYNGGPYASYHSGQDFGAPEGALVTAPADGVVALAEPLAVRGNAILLDHGRGVFTGYWHLSELNVAPGQQVSTGDLLGLVGTTGLSTGNHLHWELRIFGIGVNPVQFLEEPIYLIE